MAKDIVIIPASGQIEFSGSSTDYNVLTVNSRSISITANEFRIVDGNIVADNYIVSSSVTHLTQSFSSGSTQFGDTSTDEHLFEGHISASGDVKLHTGNHIQWADAGTKIQGTDASLMIESDNIMNLYADTRFIFHDANVGIGIGNLNPPKELTVAGDISASGTHFMATASIGGGIFTSASLAAGGGGGGGDIDISGTPVNNQLAIWTDADTLEGDAELTYDGSELNVAGDISASGNHYLATNKRIWWGVPTYASTSIYGGSDLYLGANDDVNIIPNDDFYIGANHSVASEEAYVWGDAVYHCLTIGSGSLGVTAATKNGNALVVTGSLAITGSGAHTQLLEIVGTADQLITLQNTKDSGEFIKCVNDIGETVILVNQGNPGNAYLEMFGSGSSPSSIHKFTDPTQGADSYVNFANASSSTAYFGVGTNTPTKALEVFGDISASDDLYLGGNDIYGGTTKRLTLGATNTFVGSVSSSADSTASFGHIMVGGADFSSASLAHPADVGTITALNNQTANRLVTIGSTTTELDGEANLTFDGSVLNVAGEITSSEAIFAKGTNLDFSVSASATTALNVGGAISASGVISSSTIHLNAGSNSTAIDIKNSQWLYFDGTDTGIRSYTNDRLLFKIDGTSATVVMTAEAVAINGSGFTGAPIPSSLTVTGDMKVTSHITSSGHISASATSTASLGHITTDGEIIAYSASFGKNATKWHDGYHGNDEFIPLFLHDFDFANDSSRGALNYSTNEGGATDVMYAPYEALAAKIIPRGFEAYAGVVWGNSTSVTHEWYSSSLSVGTKGTVDLTQQAVNTTETFANKVAGDGETYIVCMITTNATSDEIYGGKIFIRRMSV